MGMKHSHGYETLRGNYLCDDCCDKTAAECPCSCHKARMRSACWKERFERVDRAMNAKTAHGIITAALVAVAATGDTPTVGWRGTVVSGAFAAIMAVPLWRILVLVRGWRRGRR